MDTPDTKVSSNKKPPVGIFLATVFVVFILTLSAADSVGFVPNYIDGSTSFDSAQDKTLTTSVTDTVSLADLPQLGGLRSIEAIVAEVAQQVSLPERIVISAISMDLPIQNHATKDIDALTEVLKNGPARYVDSAKLGEKGNMLVFGHSSQLPIVRNQMYKAFNNISKLNTGDTITVYGGPSPRQSGLQPRDGGGEAYVYSVVSVREGDADEDVIDLSRAKGTRLTLVTCNTLGEKSARWIVEAEFIGTVPSAN